MCLGKISKTEKVRYNKIMENNILPENEFKAFEDRRYLDPSLGVPATDQFIDNLKQTQQANNAQIASGTQALGTDISSSLGGLGGSQDYWTSRYQTSQTNSATADLRAAARATALKEALANEKAMWDKRYKDAYRAYQRRAWNKSNTTNDNTSDAPDNINSNETTVEISDVTTEAIAGSRYQKLLDKYVRAGYPTDVAEQKAKEDFGKSVDVDAPVDQYQYSRKKSAVGGDNAYIYTLPNGNTVLVKEDKYELVQTGGSYALKNKETGELMQIGG